MQVNFIAQVMAFERWLESNPLPASAQLLWYKLFVLFDRCGWAEWVQVDNLRIMVMISAHSEKSAILAREKLVEAGLIRYEKGKKSKPGRYKMIYFDCKFYSENDSVFDSKNDSKNAVYSTVQTTAINKHKHKQSIIEEKDKKEVHIPNELSESWSEFAEMRKRIKAPLTDGAATRILNALEKLAPNDYPTQIAILHQSTDNCWKSVYRLKDQNKDEPQRSYDIDKLERQLWDNPIVNGEWK